MKKVLVIIGLALLTYQCDKEDEDDNESKTDKTGNTVDACPKAVTDFTPIQTAIDSSCANSNCHVNPGGGNTKLYFVKGADKAAQNRKVLAEYHGGFWKKAGNLYKKIGPNYATHTLKNTNNETNEGHVGGNKPSFPDETEITGWTTAEAGCN